MKVRNDSVTMSNSCVTTDCTNQVGKIKGILTLCIPYGIGEKTSLDLSTEVKVMVPYKTCVGHFYIW